MALEYGVHRFGFLTLSTAYDARRSSITGTTLNGPNGSGQFFPVGLSTANDFQVDLSTGWTPSTTRLIIGILQNAPGPGDAADVGYFGLTPAIAGSTFARGTLLQPSSTSGGYVVPYATGNGMPIGVCVETPTAVGSVFGMALFGLAHGGFST